MSAGVMNQQIRSPTETTVWVDSANTGGTAGTEADPAETIALGITAASATDVIFVLAGTYNELNTPKNNITIIGELDAAGDWLTIIEPESIDITWSLATTEYPNGPTVYKTTDIPADAKELSHGGIRIGKMLTSSMNAGDAGDLMLDSLRPHVIDQWVINGITRSFPSQDFWEGIYSIWGRDTGGTTFFKHRDSLNPNNLSLVVGLDTHAKSGFYMDSRSNVTLKNLYIRGFKVGVHIRQSTAADNLIEGCRFSANELGVRLAYEFSHNNTVRSCTFIGGQDRTTGIDAGAHSSNHPKGEMIYRFAKNFSYTDSSTYSGVHSQWPGSDNVVEDCTFTDNMTAIGFWHNATSQPGVSDGNIIRNNTINNGCSQGISGSGDLTNYLVYGNTFNNCNTIIRFSRWYEATQTTSIYIFNNTFWNPTNLGRWLGATGHDGDPDPLNIFPNMYIYNNSFSQSSAGVGSFGGSYDAVKNVHYQNNVYNGCKPYPSGITTPQTHGTFDYNWMSETPDNTGESWYGLNNIVDSGNDVWTVSDTEPDWILPTGPDHAAIGAAGTIPAGWNAPTTGLSGSNMGAVR